MKKFPAKKFLFYDDQIWYFLLLDPISTFANIKIRLFEQSKSLSFC